MKYNTVDDWLNEIENYSLRAERIPAEAIPWVREAWRLGQMAGMQQVLDAVKPKIEAIDESNKRLCKILCQEI